MAKKRATILRQAQLLKAQKKQASIIRKIESSTQPPQPAMNPQRLFQKPAQQPHDPTENDQFGRPPVKPPVQKKLDASVPPSHLDPSNFNSDVVKAIEQLAEFVVQKDPNMESKIIEKNRKNIGG